MQQSKIVRATPLTSLLHYQKVSLGDHEAGAIMRAERALTSKYLTFGFAIPMTVVAAFGSVGKAQAQVDANIQSRLAPYTISVTPSASGPQQPMVYTVCKSPAELIVLLRQANRHQLVLPPNLEYIYKQHGKMALQNYLQLPENRKMAAQLLDDYFSSHPEIAKVRWWDLPKYWRLTEKKSADLRSLLPPSPINFCTTQGAPRTATVKVSFPFNPTYESNVLKSNQNNSPGTSLGFGGAVQVTIPGIETRPLDVIGLSAQSQSVRYGQFPSKSFDAIITQAAYQFFIDAYGLGSDGKPFGVYYNTPKEQLPPTNMITVNTVAVGVQNQTVYLPLFRTETVDLFTPQITFNHLNMPLADRQCAARIPDPSKDGFCYYADISLTLGETLSDVPSQQNANVAVAVTPGWRIPDSDWRLTLPTTATARDYQNVAGGRQDVLLQVGPTLAYAPPPFIDISAITSVLFTLSATYNQNFSTISKDAWHGVIIMPTLTIAFQPPPN
jgi:hypothetical protein